MADVPPELLTAHEARFLLTDWLNASADPAYRTGTLLDYLRERHDRRIRRLKKAAEQLTSVYGQDMAADQLIPIEAGTQWSVTPYGLLCLEEPGYRLTVNALFDRHLIEHMGGKGWVDMVEFAFCLLYARAYHASEGEWQHW